MKFRTETPCSRACENGRNHWAFTRAEVLAAIVFMAILIPVALEGLSIASRAGEVAARKSEAALVAEKILNETIATTNWSTAGQNRTVRQGIRDFRWKLNNDAWNQDSNESGMGSLSVEVTFEAQGFRLQCFSSSGVISDNDNALGADVQEVTYDLQDPISGGGNSGKDLVRSINRNPLGTAGLNPEEQRLLGHVESLEFAGYDG